MFITKLISVTLVLSIVLQGAVSQRRIKDGIRLTKYKRYMVYLTRAPTTTNKQYDAWICGGAIVNPVFIVTSAACVQDIQFMYAIAGYDKYVPYNQIATDECTKNARKKIVFICCPKGYSFDYGKIEKWSDIDIAAVRVESPYDFNAKAPLPSCTWVPGMVKVNYDRKAQVPGVDAIVLGWGHKSKWRDVDDTNDYNEKFLMYGPAKIMNKTECKTHYEKVPGLPEIIDKYMICTLLPGDLDAEGEVISNENNKHELLDGCAPRKVMGPDGRCLDILREGATNPEGSLKEESAFKEEGSFKEVNWNTRRNGICQNDHGGPLITWIGAHEVLIGVASVFLVSATSECVGPYLYTSTQCNGAFLNCVLNVTIPPIKISGEDTRRHSTSVCDQPPMERGFDIVSRRISWMQHPDGPAANELEDDLIPRAQIPINAFN